MKKLLLFLVIVLTSALCQAQGKEMSHADLINSLVGFVGDYQKDNIQRMKSAERYTTEAIVYSEKLYINLRNRIDSLQSRVKSLEDIIYISQEDIKNAEFPRYVAMQFENINRQFNFLYGKVDSLELRIKKLEKGNANMPNTDEINFGDLLYRETIPIPADSVFDKNALIRLNEKPKTIWPGLWRSGVDWKKVREELFRP